MISKYSPCSSGIKQYRPLNKIITIIITKKSQNETNVKELILFFSYIYKILDSLFYFDSRWLDLQQPKKKNVCASIQ
ncbi:hypothetical protein DERF_006098 [Dermatophagoides farinae]|uniref:Uncharacterized protein n=1 Tax=Dermatophagoides farinae TaxID=6954 RepID=A0A922L7B9_DERFA|nr:hypothetical protein DERF_006098 [Dermatophagoides farinae]